MRKFDPIVVTLALLMAGVYTDRSIAQDLPAGPQVLTFFSDVDDTDQPYALYLPPDFDASRRYPLVVSLHGAGSNHRLNLRRVFGKSNAPGETDVEASRYFPEWADVDYIVASPYARGTMGYQGVAEKDVWDVLEDVKARFLIDENRIYLTGLSMGGGGTLWLGLSRPDVWAAIAPVCPAPPAGTEMLAPNARNLPVHIFQGDADPVVGPEGVREWVKNLRELGTKVEYTEYAGVGHDSWVNAYANGQIFEWFSQFHRDPYPDHVRFVSDRYQYSKAYWAEMDAITPGSLSRLEAVFTELNRVLVTTFSLDGFTLRLTGHPKFASDQPVSVSVDGALMEVNAGEAISFSRKNGEWVPERYEATENQKRRGHEGPMSEAVARRHVYVYGTLGAKSEAEIEARREQAETAANWSIYRGPFWGRVMMFPRVVADRDLRPSDLETSDLVLFGTRETNSLIEEYGDQLPIHLDASGDEYGLIYIFPVGRRYWLISSGAPWWDAEALGSTSPFTSQITALELMGLPDYGLFHSETGDVLVEGHFDSRWSLPEQDAERMEATGVVSLNANMAVTGS